VRGLFYFCFLNETIFGNGQIAITHNVLQIGGRFNAANCVLAAVFFLFDYQQVTK
jgi:hypothetical protein